MNLPTVPAGGRRRGRPSAGPGAGAGRAAGHARLRHPRGGARLPRWRAGLVLAALLEWTAVAASDTGLFAEGAIHRLDLQLDRTALQSLREQPRTFVRATLRSATEPEVPVAVRLKGSVGSFRAVDDRPSLTLDFARDDAAGRFHGLRRMQLDNSVEDRSRLHEWIGAELFRAAGLPAPRISHARVRLNRRELGLYVLKEGFTPEFLAGAFGRADGVLYDDDTGHDVDQDLHVNLGPGRGREAETAALNALARATREPDPAARWSRLEGLLDVDHFVTFMAVEVLVGHRDGYCIARNNFRLYHDPGTGRFVFLPDGLDQLFGNARLPWKPRMGGLVAAAVLGTPEGERRYTARFRTLLDEMLRVDLWTDRIDRVVAALSPGFTAAERTEISREADDLKARIAARVAHLHQQLNDPGVPVAVFANGVARLGGWTPVDEPVPGAMSRASSPDGRAALLIEAAPGSGASWRTRVILPAGRYRFAGQGRVAGVVPRSGSRQPGAGLRVGGRLRAGPGLLGDTDWQALGAEFAVAGSEETVELICELNADRGHFWVDLASLRVERVGGEDRP